MRPAEVDVLRGDYSLAELEMEWVPQTNFSELVKKMVDNDLKLLS
jgi:GDP-D-mannose dehydratase